MLDRTAAEGRTGKGVVFVRFEPNCSTRKYNELD